MNPILLSGAGQGAEFLENAVGQFLLAFHEVASNLIHEVLQLLRVFLESRSDTEFPPMVTPAGHMGTFDDFPWLELALPAESYVVSEPLERIQPVVQLAREVIQRQNPQVSRISGAFYHAV